MGDGVLNESGILDLRRRMAESGPSSGGSAGLASRFDILPLYVEEVVERLGPCPPFRVVLDGGNGAAGPVCLETLRRLGAEVIPLFCSPDGRFPHHPPDPAKEENMLALREAVLAHGADLGIGLDGDGDRIGVMDRKGRLLAGDELLAVYARDLLARVPGARVLADVKCSERLFRDILARGGEPEMCRTGHAPLKARLRESGALLAGELSGHICHAENWYGFDDATYCAGRLLGALGRLGEPLERLPGWPPAWITPERDIPCPDEKKFDVVRRALEWFRARRPVIDIDGVRVLYDGGWGLVRASNTSPSLTLRFEAVSPERLAFIRRDMEDRVRKWADEAG
jgi:phosphomannomutase/phosphoglucomutase